jgi:hypothetical protein
MLIFSDAAVQQNKQGAALMYTTIESQHSAIQAANATISLRFGGTRCLGITHSFIPSVQMNTIRADSFRCVTPRNGANPNDLGTVAPIRSCQFYRNGIPLSKDFRLQTLFQYNPTQPYTQILEAAQHSVDLYSGRNSSLSTFTSQSQLNIATQDSPVLRNRPFNTLPDPNCVNAVGIPFTSTRNGIGLKSSLYTVSIDSELNNSTPMSVFSFVQTRQILVNKGGVLQVIE